MRHWKGGKLKGPFIGWNRAGRKQVEGYYWDGRKDGLWTEYNEDGTEKSRKIYDRGKVVK